MFTVSKELRKLNIILDMPQNLLVGFKNYRFLQGQI